MIDDSTISQKSLIIQEMKDPKINEEEKDRKEFHKSKRKYTIGNNRGSYTIQFKLEVIEFAEKHTNHKAVDEYKIDRS